MGQVFYQFTEIDSPVGGKIENGLAAVEQVFDLDQFHFHAALLDPAETEVKGVFFLCAVLLGRLQVFGAGLSQDGFDPFRDFAVVKGERSFYYLADGFAAVRFDNDQFILL